jgi:hypothetical protein
MKSIAVFCASSAGHDPIYREVAYETGAQLAREGIQLVYGGSRIGLMGAIADGAIDNGGLVIGVLPNFLRSREIAHEGLSSLILVESMQERKLKMHELSDGVIALPGGFGTFEELFEMLTWGQLGLHQKAIGVLNVKSYFSHLAMMMDHMEAEGLLKKTTRNMLMMSDSLDSLLSMMHAYNPPEPVINMQKYQA